MNTNTNNTALMEEINSIITELCHLQNDVQGYVVRLMELGYANIPNDKKNALFKALNGYPSITKNILSSIKDEVLASNNIPGFKVVMSSTTSVVNISAVANWLRETYDATDSEIEDMYTMKVTAIDSFVYKKELVNKPTLKQAGARDLWAPACSGCLAESRVFKVSAV